MLLTERTHLGLDQVGDVHRRADLRAFTRVQAHQPSPELECRLKLNRFYLAHAMMPTQFGNARGTDSAQAAESSEQPVCKIQHAAGPPAGPQDDGQQLSIRERAGAGVHQPLAWPHRLGEVFQPDPVFSQAWRGDLCTPPCGSSPTRNRGQYSTPIRTAHAAGAPVWTASSVPPVRVR